MKIRQLLTMGMIAAITSGMATATIAAGAGSQQTASVSAKKEAKSHHRLFGARSKRQRGQIGGTIPLDSMGTSRCQSASGAVRVEL
jgi:hypothetical protein